MENVYLMKRKLSIEVLRIWFTICICLHHFHMYSENLPFGGGYLAVDFFYMISGFYLMDNFSRQKETSFNICTLGRYIKKRYIRLWPDYLWAFLMTLCIKIVLGRAFKYTNIWMLIQELLMVDFNFSSVSTRINPATWYCSYLLLTSIIVYVLLSFRKKLVYI